MESSSLLHRIAFGSCNRVMRASPWKLIESYQPDKVVILGDIVYADGTAYSSLPSIEKRIQQSFHDLTIDLGWRSLFKYMNGWSNIYATYDDHDYGTNNADKHMEARNYSIESFLNFTGVALDSPLRQQPGVYRSHVTNVQFSDSLKMSYKVIMLDERSNKDRKGTVNGNFLGKEQWEWFQAEMSDAYKYDLVVIGSGLQLLRVDGLAEESWNEFPQQRETMLQYLSLLNSYTNVVVLSGDIHQAEISQAICKDWKNNNNNNNASNKQVRKLWEFTSSGLTHSFGFGTQAVALGASLEDPQELLRSTVALVIMTSYQAVSPRPHRERGFADGYNGVHFALLDIIPPQQQQQQQQQESGGNWLLNVSYVNPSRDVVLHRPIPFPHSIPVTVTVDEETEYKKQWASLSESTAAATTTTTTTKVLEGVCQPIWGEVPVWRQWVSVFVASMALMVFVILPLLTVLWLLFASCFYIFYESEQRRRERIEARYQKMKST